MFSKDFRDFILLLNENQVEYLIVGGYAVGVHGFPRYTGDIDIWLNRTNKNILKMPKVLQEFGFVDLNIDKSTFLNKENIFRIGNPPFRIDIMTDIDGVNFNECYLRKIIKEIDGLKISFIGYEDLIENKKASGRKKDQLDLDNLQ